MDFFSLLLTETISREKVFIFSRRKSIDISRVLVRLWEERPRVFVRFESTANT